MFYDSYNPATDLVVVVFCGEVSMMNLPEVIFDSICLKAETHYPISLSRGRVVYKLCSEEVFSDVYFGLLAKYLLKEP